MELDYQFLPEEGDLLRDYTVSLDLTQHLRRERLDYERDGLDTTVTRWSGSLEPTVELEYRDKHPETPTRLTLTYGYSQAMPSLYYQLGTVDDSDPANVYVNNPGLRRASTHNASLEFTRFWQATHRNLAVNANFSHTNRAVAQARHYDRQTGVSTWVPPRTSTATGTPTPRCSSRCPSAATRPSSSRRARPAPSSTRWTTPPTPRN